MSDVKFLRIIANGDGAAYDHDGYKTLMRQLADPEFRAAHKDDTLVVLKNGKPFIKITIVNG